MSRDPPQDVVTRTEDRGDPVHKVDDHEAFGGTVQEAKQQAACVVPAEERVSFYLLDGMPLTRLDAWKNHQMFQALRLKHAQLEAQGC